MSVLALVHGEDAGPELFGPLVAEAGHRMETWSFERGTPPPLDSYDAVFVFGGFMHPDQDDLFPWLPEETDWLRPLLEGPMPTLGICLGLELLARAAGAWVGPLAVPEIGWGEVELTAAGVADPVFSALPPRFEGCYGTTTRTTCRREASRWPTALRRCRRSVSVRPAGASSSTPR